MSDRIYDPVVCGKPKCDVSFVPTRHNQKYCVEHRTKPNRERYKYLREADEKELGVRYCGAEGCRKSLKGERASNPRVKYCSDLCSRQEKDRRSAERSRQKRAVKIAERSGTEMPWTARQGGLLVELEEVGDAEKIDAGTLSVHEAAILHDTTKANVSRSMDAWRILQSRERQAAEWEPACVTQAMLPVEKLIRIRELGADAVGGDEFELLADELTRAYAVFSRRFFLLEGMRPLVKGFHLRWIRSIIVAYATGGKQMILAPPRHGKSEVLIRFSVWLIAMFPNIRIGWFAAAAPVAKMMLGSVKDHLANNKELIRATLPPGHKYRPLVKEGKPWSSIEIKVQQQSHVGQKSSSMLALGRTSKFLSRDFDIIYVDDMEDFDTTRELGQRKYSKNKLAEIGTRKEEHTAEIVIASRQHPDDIPNKLISLSGGLLAWNVMVDTAHDPMCPLDPDEIAGHYDCMLFPEVRSYRWLMEKKIEMEALGLPGMYEMRYLNQAVATEGIVFDIERIRDKALDRSRDIGIAELGPGRMIGGLDPASRGVQAAFAWHFAPGALTMIDLETQEAGGFAGAIRVMKDWADRYGIVDWYYEDNSQQDEFFRDPRVQTLKKEYGLTIKPHTTGKNKQDPELGISSMAPWYHDGTIILPYGTAEARRKVNLLLGQLSLWTTDGVPVGRNRKTDVKMASWFPFPRIVRWNRVETQQTRIHRGTEQSYPSVSRTASVPWRTAYPKGR